jgi:hypothetical protein
MKLSEAVEIMEQNQAIKERVIEKCIEEIGEKVEIKFVVWNDVTLINQDTIKNPSELRFYGDKLTSEKFLYDDTQSIHSLHSDIIKDAGINEYNDNIIAMQILQGYKVYEITRSNNIPMKHYKTIKDKIYESIKKRQQDQD